LKFITSYDELGVDIVSSSLIRKKYLETTFFPDLVNLFSLIIQVSITN